VNLRIDNDSRIAIVGRNGSGKSTLLGLIVGQLTPTKGEMYRYHNLRIGYFSQHHVDQLNLALSPLEHFMAKFKGIKEQEARAHLGSFGVQGNLALQKMSTLSGGQKSRVVFATITFEDPHMMVMDEPTNHLDFDTIEALTNAISEYQGAVLIVSHDQSLVASVAKELQIVAKSKVTKFLGTFVEYRSAVMKEEL